VVVVSTVSGLLLSGRKVNKLNRNGAFSRRNGAGQRFVLAGVFVQRLSLHLEGGEADRQLRARICAEEAHIGGTWLISPWKFSIIFSISSRVTLSKLPVVRTSPSASMVVVAAPRMPILSYSCHQLCSHRCTRHTLVPVRYCCRYLVPLFTPMTTVSSQLSISAVTHPRLHRQEDPKSLLDRI